MTQTAPPNELQVHIPLGIFQSLMISHVRDSLHRHGYIVPQCINLLKEYWILLNSNTRELIQDDIQWHLNEYSYLAKDEFVKTAYAAWQETLAWVKAHRDSEYNPQQPETLALRVLNPKQREK